MRPARGNGPRRAQDQARAGGPRGGRESSNAFSGGAMASRGAISGLPVDGGMVAKAGIADDRLGPQPEQVVPHAMQ